MNCCAPWPGYPRANWRPRSSMLCDSGLVFRRGHPPEARFLFKHVLVQDAAYGSLLRADRRDLHRRIAEALEAHFSEITATQPELLAHHFTEANMAERAVRYWLKAGQQALGLSGMMEAAALLRKGLSLIVSRARQYRAPGIRARSANRPRPGIDRDAGICRAGGEPSLRSRARTW